jgi:MFS family permease
MQSSPPPQKMARYSPWTVLAFLCIPVFVGSIDLTIVSAILPEVIVSLGLPAENYLDDAFWMITAYLLAYTISMVFVGRLSDLVGRRAVYVATLLLFMFGSYWVAVAHTWPTELYRDLHRQLYPDARPLGEIAVLHMIILGRVLQALGAGAAAPVTMALVADLFPPERRARPIGIVGGVDTVGWVLGHLYGGAMVKFFDAQGPAIADFMADLGLDWGVPDWRTLFWFNLIFGLITLGAVFFSLRGLGRPRLREGFDGLGTLLLVGALIALTFGLGTSNEAPSDIQSFQNADRGSPLALPALILAGALFAAFIFWERRVRYPLFNLRLFRDPNVAAASFSNVAVGFCLTIGLVALPILVNIRESQANIAGIRDAALIAGLLLSGLTVPMALAALPGGWLTEKYGYRAATLSGLGLMVAGFMLVVLFWETGTAYEIMGLQMAVAGVGLGLTISPIGAAVVNAAGEDERGAASAMVLALRLVGMTIALSGLTDFAINRVNDLVAANSAGLPDTSPLYLQMTVQVAGELFLLGAGVGLLAMVAAWWLRGGERES